MWVLGKQVGRELLTTTTDEHGNMWFLHTLGLVNSVIDMIIFAFKYSLILCPHRQDHLYRFTQITQAFGRIGLVVAIGAEFMFVPACTNAKVQASMRKNINSAGHFC